MGQFFQRYRDDLQRVRARPLWGLFVVGLLILPANVMYLWIMGKVGPQGLTVNNTYFGRDFVNFWNGGNLALHFDVMRLYDVDAYWQWIQQSFHPAINQMLFSYPPNILPLLVPFGALPYGVALGLWQVLGILAFWCVSFYRTAPGRSWLSFAVTATNSSVLCNILFGQLGFFLAAGIVGGLRLLPARPVFAGVLIGLVAFKPQLGPLLVLTLVMQRQWRTMSAAIITAAAVAGFSVMLWGLAPWHYYLTTTLSAQASFLHTAEGYWAAQMTTPFAIMRYLGLPYPVSMAFQILVSIVVMIASVAVLRRKQCPWSLQVAVIAFGATLLTPYLLVYDLAMPVAALLWHISDQDAKFSEQEFLILALLWLLPFAVGITLQAAGLPVIAITMCACFGTLVHKALHTETMNRVSV